MRRLTPIVLVAILVGALVPVAPVTASHDTDPGDIDPLADGTYDGVMYDSKGEHTTMDHNVPH